MEHPTGIDATRQTLAAAAQALAGMGGRLYAVANADLGDLLSEVDALLAAGAGIRAETLLETVRRGIHTEAGKDAREWVLEYCPSLRQAGAGQLARIVTETAKRTAITAGCDYDAPNTGIDPVSPIAMIWDQVRTGHVAPPLALAVLSEIDKLSDRLQPGAIPTATAAMLTIGAGFGPAAMRELKMKLIATYGLPDEVDSTQRRLSRHSYLTSPQPESGDLTRYSLGLTPAQAAALEAALGPLSKPQPNPETGEADLRSNGQRRAEALIELTGRAASADAQRKGGPAESDATVFVTVNLADLQSETGAGEVIGSRADGTILSASQLRAMCCDADLIPVVLGTDGEALDHGMTVRLFTRAQRRAIWRRDRRCTYPGCTAPGAWTRVHHVRHWADRGPTDISNAALLCQRHHTHVHRKRLWADVSTTPDEYGRCVHWDLTEGSYDYALRGSGRPPEPRRQPHPWQAA